MFINYFINDLISRMLLFQILNLRENIIETRVLLQQILTCVGKPGENKNLMEEQQQPFIPELSRTKSDHALLEMRDSEKKVDFDEEVFPDDPDDELSTDDTDLVETQAHKSDATPSRKVSLDRLRIMTDLPTKRIQSIDSVRSITDDDSFDSAL